MRVKFMASGGGALMRSVFRCLLVMLTVSTLASCATTPRFIGVDENDPLRACVDAGTGIFGISPSVQLAAVDTVLIQSKAKMICISPGTHQFSVFVGSFSPIYQPGVTYSCGNAYFKDLIILPGRRYEIRANIPLWLGGGVMECEFEFSDVTAATRLVVAKANGSNNYNWTPIVFSPTK